MCARMCARVCMYYVRLLAQDTDIYQRLSLHPNILHESVQVSVLYFLRL